MLVQAAKLIGAGLAVSAISGAGTGIGTVFAALINAVARNPNMNSQLFSYAILGFALTEAIALFGLMMAFLLLFSNKLKLGRGGGIRTHDRRVKVGRLTAWLHP
jgi:F-type H+-transporting ATPase subunit c